MLSDVSPAMTNTLYYGDNLDILRQHVGDESVDLVYLDPPFNSNANYNVLFKERSGEESPAQIKAFTDTWEWTQESERTFEQEIVLNPETPPNVKNMITAFRQFIGSNAMMSYLVMMTPRLVELRRVLKPTGSIYLHCDPTASHYLKLLMDTVFGKERFLTEIHLEVGTSAHSDTKQGRQGSIGRVHDLIAASIPKERNGTHVESALHTPMIHRLCSLSSTAIRRTRNGKDDHRLGDRELALEVKRRGTHNFEVMERVTHVTWRYSKETDAATA